MKKKAEVKPAICRQQGECSQEECLHIFDLLRTDPSWLLNAAARNSFMERIGELKDILNKKQSELQENILIAAKSKKKHIESWIGPRIHCEEIELNEAPELQRRLQEAGYSIREIYKDDYSLFRALSFALLERRIDMHPYFLSVDFFKLPSRTQRLLKDSLARLKKNPTELQLGMEMNVQEISNAWASFLRLLSLPEEQKVAKCPEKDVESLVFVVGRTGQTQLQLLISNVSEKFRVPIEIVDEKTQLLKLEEDSILLFHTPKRIGLLYS